MNLISNAKIRKDELLDVMKTNRERHKNDVAALLGARRLEIEEKYQEALQLMRNNEDYQPEEYQHFPIPEDHTKGYNRAIRMVEMTTDEVIELTEQQFDQLVLDNWAWKEQFNLANATYTGKLR